MLPVVLFVGVAAALGSRQRSRGAAAVFAISGLVLGVAFGSARLGADVGGVITVGAGAAVATLVMLPERITWRGVLVVVVTPIVAVVALAGLDLATGGNGHFTRTVLHAHGEGAITDIVVRRYELALNVLGRGLMPFATAIAVLALAYGIRFRQRLLAPIAGVAGLDGRAVRGDRVGRRRFAGQRLGARAAGHRDVRDGGRARLRARRPAPGDRGSAGNPSDTCRGGRRVDS